MATNSNLHRIFCARVREQRKRLGLTQVEVAERLGITQPSYAAIEGGKASPSLAVVERVAAALSIAPSDLLVAEEPAEAA